jgi:hypothetical protein
MSILSPSVVTRGELNCDVDELLLQGRDLLFECVDIGSVRRNRLLSRHCGRPPLQLADPLGSSWDW